MFEASSLAACDYVCECEECVVVGYFVFYGGGIQLGEYNQYRPLY